MEERNGRGATLRAKVAQKGLVSTHNSQCHGGWPRYGGWDCCTVMEVTRLSPGVPKILEEVFRAEALGILAHASAPDAIVCADATATSLRAAAALWVMQMDALLQSLHLLLRRLCWQIEVPGPQSLDVLLCRLCVLAHIH